MADSRREPFIRVMLMPKETNVHGTILGGDPESPGHCGGRRGKEAYGSSRLCTLET